MTAQAEERDETPQEILLALKKEMVRDIRYFELNESRLQFLRYQAKVKQFFWPFLNFLHYKSIKLLFYSYNSFAVIV